MRCSMFNEELSKFYGAFQQGKIYLISKGKISTQNGKYSQGIKSDYQITLGRESTVSYFGDDDKEIRNQKYSFIPIKNVNDLDENRFCDIVGVVTTVGPMENITSKKTGKNFKKRNVELADKTAKIEMTLWGDDAENNTAENLTGVILAIKGCKVSGFNGRTLSGGQVAISPSGIDQATAIQEWYQQAGGNIEVASLTVQGGGRRPDEWTTLIQTEELGQNTEKPDFFTVRAQVVGMPQYTTGQDQRDPWYMSCPKDGCNKKAIEGGGGWTCAHENCVNQVFDKAEPRFILRFQVGDHTCTKWLNSFHDVALKLLAKPAAEIIGYKNAGNEGAYEKCFKDPSFIGTWKFTCRAKAEMYMNELKTRVVAVRAEPMDWVSECSRLIAKIGSA